jgi:MOSC domain-containing protein YiiM
LKESDRGRLFDLMKILSVNVGGPREVEWKGKLIRTSIFKSPQNGSVKVFKLNLEGDKQSDLTVHGGVDKAVYAYPSEHYSFWRQEFPDLEITWGAFGENLTTEGLLETAVHIGDTLQIGSARFVITQPRLPCFKLGIRLGRADIVKRFLRSEKSGFYFSVLEEGTVTAGDLIQLLGQDPQKITVADIASLFGRNLRNRELLRTASQLSALSSSLRDEFRSRNQTDAG